MSSIEVYEQVAAGKLSASQGAELLMPASKPLLRQPAWMPRWAFIIVFIAAYVLLAPFVGNQDRRA